MKNILVTGGAGYIGSHTCIELMSAGYNVIIVDDLSNSKKIAVDRIEQISGKRLPFIKRVFLTVLLLMRFLQITKLMR